MKRRIIALLTAAMLLMAICPAALAEPTPTPTPTPTPKPPITQGDIMVNVESVATASFGVDMQVKITVDPKITTGTLTLDSVTATAGILNSDVRFNGITSADLSKYDAAIDVVIRGMFKGAVSGSAIEQFKLSFTYTYKDASDAKQTCKVEKHLHILLLRRSSPLLPPTLPRPRRHSGCPAMTPTALSLPPHPARTAARCL